MDNELIRPNEKTVMAGKNITLISDGHGLPWGTDASLLASYIRKAKRMCELGSGSGVVSLLCASSGKCSDIKAVEIREDMADISERSVKLNGLEDKVSVICKDIREIKAEDPDMGGRFDAVFSNPPYIAHQGIPGSDASKMDARHEQNGGIDDFCAAAARLLNFKGSFYVVFRPERLPDLFESLRKYRLEPKRMTVVYADTESVPSVVLVEAVSGGAPRLTVSAPLIMYTDDRSVSPRRLTEKAAYIIENCTFPKENRK